MIKSIRTFGLGLAAAAVFATGSAPRPAAANTSTTLTTIAGAAAVVGGIILYNNYQHKRQAANQVVGYTRNGGSILGDGRIVMPNGQTYHPNSNGQYSWGQYAYYTNRFNTSNVIYDQNRSGQYDRMHRHDDGLHRGWTKNVTPAYTERNDRREHQEMGKNQQFHDNERGKDKDRDDKGHGHGHGHGHDGD
jgi:hypothetical protein